MISDEAVEKSEEQYRLLAENSTDMILVFNVETGRRQYISPASLALTGYSPEEYLASDFVESVHPDDKERVARERDGTVKDGVPTQSTYRTRRKDGSYRWVEVRRSPILDPKTGKVQLMHAVVRDVDDRERAYQDLHASEERYRLLADNSTDIIGRLDLSGWRTYISPACLPIMGYAPDELVGTPADAFVHPDDKHLMAQAFERLFFIPGAIQAQVVHNGEQAFKSSRRCDSSYGRCYGHSF